MRAIIIKDTDARALLDSLKLESLQILAERIPITVEDMHRRFHYRVTKWLQEQGADCVG
jgi:hypothetical protein